MTNVRGSADIPTRARKANYNIASIAAVAAVATVYSVRFRVFLL